jgi:hypothetical protein
MACRPERTAKSTFTIQPGGSDQQSKGFDEPGSSLQDSGGGVQKVGVKIEV